MPTLVEFLPVATGPSPVAVAPVTSDDVQLAALAQAGKLTGWWRADQGLTSGGWLDRVNDILLTAQRGSLPTFDATGGANGKPRVIAPTTASCLISPVGVFPANASFSIAVVGRLGAGAGAATVGFFAGNAANDFAAGVATSSYAALWAGGAQLLRGDGVTANNAAGVKLLVYSFQYTSASAQQAKIRINGAETNVWNAGTGRSWTDTRFSVLDVGLSQFYPVSGAEIEDVFLFPVALHADAGTVNGLSALQSLEAYVRNRYALW